jgi:hypothetical protein
MGRCQPFGKLRLRLGEATNIVWKACGFGMLRGQTNVKQPDLKAKYVMGEKNLGFWGV